MFHTRRREIDEAAKQLWAFDRPGDADEDHDEDDWARPEVFKDRELSDSSLTPTRITAALEMRAQPKSAQRRAYDGDDDDDALLIDHNISSV
jgi:hypothetical protein